METARWIIAGALGAASLLVIVGNPVAALLAQRRGESYSFVPVVGGATGVAACLVCPAIGFSWWAIVPLVMDVTVPMALVVLALMALRSDD
jgi:hypothetical protein